MIRNLKYFESIILLYSLIENLTKWLTLVKTLWEKSGQEMRDGEADTLRNFFKTSAYATDLYFGYALAVMDYPLFQELLRLKNDRNDRIHDFWLYSNRADSSELRTELEGLAHAANTLVGIFNKLTEQIGIDEVYDFFVQEK